MTTREFNQLLHMAVDTHKLDPAKTYVEFTWWDGIFLPFTTTDADDKKSDFILVFGKCPCNTFYKTSCQHEQVPTAFWIWNNAVYVDQIVHRPLTISTLIDSKSMLDRSTVKFLFSNSPINYYVDINPFKTRIFINRENDIILALHAENRDSGEFMSFNKMEPQMIKFIDDRPKEFRTINDYDRG